MKSLLLALFVCCATVPAADKPASAGQPLAARPETSVSKCFKVRRLLRSDSTHYWADWTNTCPFTIEAVYVMVGFVDRARHEMGSGVWPMYFVEPGAHRVTRFSAPVAEFETVRVHRITTDSAVGLGLDPVAIKAMQQQALPPGTVGDTGAVKVLPYQPQTASRKTPY